MEPAMMFDAFGSSSRCELRRKFDHREQHPKPIDELHLLVVQRQRLTRSRLGGGASE